jgi:hypothetical protein
MTHIDRLVIQTAQFGARHVDAHGLVSAADTGWLVQRHIPLLAADG